MKKLLFTCTLVWLVGFFAIAQDGSMLDGLEDAPETEKVISAFKSPRVINQHSMEMLHKGALDFRILHRFGRIDRGLYDLFGLDQASMRMSFDYGVTQDFTVGVGRSTRNKEVDGFVKYRILSQTKGAKSFPFSLVWVSGMTINGLKDPFGPDIDGTLTRRSAYYHQAILGRKFNDNFSLQLTPTIVHRNLTTSTVNPNTLYGLGLGARYKVSKRVALVIDYVHAFNRFPATITNNPLSLGVDIETGGHVFQLHISNAVGMNERSFISDSNASWLDGGIQLGFNLSRVFQLKE
jgi:hypothetical protein